MLLKSEPLLSQVVDKKILKLVLQKEGDYSLMLADEHGRRLSAAWYSCTRCQERELSDTNLNDHLQRR